MSEYDIVKRWVQKAEDDLDNAIFMFENKWPRPLELVCYLCAQSAEKALKACIIQNGETPPYTHDLGSLCRMCVKHLPEFSDIVDDCLDIAPYAVQTRYPNNIEIEEAETQSALRKAERILDFCRGSALKPPLSQEQTDTDAL
ncbi:MAG: HEPN domain-containing protein [Oscillospiraceae bacterium]|jgi:HEPN domain-containing protein|nr:HEPN domain-containing protein [Oscillospiraceae bacterium]